MSTPKGHTLSTTILRVGDVYTSRCACGVDMWGTTFPEVWHAHDLHLAVVKALAMGRHPSRGER